MDRQMDRRQTKVIPMCRNASGDTKTGTQAVPKLKQFSKMWHLRELKAILVIINESNFLLDKGRVAENLQKECLCYFIISSTSLWRNQFNHILVMIFTTIYLAQIMGYTGI